jgi:hypothetical protein
MDINQPRPSDQHISADTHATTCPSGHADPIYVNDDLAECAVCGVTYDADTGVEVTSAADPTPAAIEAAARVLAHFSLFNEEKWPKYADVADRMLRAAAQVTS